MTFPLAVIAGLAPGAARAIDGFKRDGVRGAGYTLANDFTGYDPYQGKWSLTEMRRGLLPLAIGIMVHKVVGGKLGVNRALAASGIPYIRL
jgi:hypothetical protein